MRFSGYSIILLTRGSLYSWFFEIHVWVKALRQWKIGLCMELRGCACSWFCNFMNLLLLFFSWHRGDNPIYKWLCALKKKASLQKGLDSAFSRLRTLNRQVLMWTILKGVPWWGKPFCFNQLRLQRWRPGPDGMVKLAAKHAAAEVSGSSSSLAFTSSAESRVTFCICANVFHPAPSVW